jgi:hypothetical protein
VPVFAFPKQRLGPDLPLAHRLLIGLGTVVADDQVELGLIEMALDHVPIVILGTLGLQTTGIAGSHIGLVDSDALSIAMLP